jgi:hypothetical protein
MEKVANDDARKDIYVPVSDVSNAYEELKRVHVAIFADSSLYISLDFAFPLLSVAGESELFFVAP